MNNIKFEENVWTIRQAINGVVRSEDFDDYETAKKEYDKVSKEFEEFYKERKKDGHEESSVELSLLQIREITDIS